jgi:hypothetical protein
VANQTTGINQSFAQTGKPHANDKADCSVSLITHTTGDIDSDRNLDGTPLSEIGNSISTFCNQQSQSADADAEEAATTSLDAIHGLPDIQIIDNANLGILFSSPSLILPPRTNQLPLNTSMPMLQDNASTSPFCTQTTSYINMNAHSSSQSTQSTWENTNDNSLSSPVGTMMPDSMPSGLKSGHEASHGAMPTILASSSDSIPVNHNLTSERKKKLILEGICLRQSHVNTMMRLPNAEEQSPVSRVQHTPLSHTVGAASQDLRPSRPLTSSNFEGVHNLRNVEGNKGRH